MEYIGGGSLHGYLKSKSNRRLEENDAKRIFSEILEGLKYCHSRCITHRDIKLENLLLDDKNIMKIIDFGFSTCIPNDKKLRFSVEHHHTWLQKLYRKLSIVDHQQTFGRLEFYFLPVFQGNFLTEERQMKNSMIRLTELIIIYLLQ